MDTAGILIIGNEVLSGKVEEANARFLIPALRAAGVRLERIVFVRDVEGEIASEVRALSERHDHVITAGGVGGTHDDITMPSVARAFGVPLETHADLLALLEAHYGERMNDAHRRIALLPAGAELVFGEGARVPVVRFRNVFVLPGNPEFVRAKFSVIRPLLRGGPVWMGEVYLAIDEESVAALLAEADRLEPEVEVGSYPRFEPGSDHRVKVTIEGPDASACDRVVRFLTDRLDEATVVRVSPTTCVGGSA